MMGRPNHLALDGDTTQAHEGTSDLGAEPYQGQAAHRTVAFLPESTW